VARLTAQEFQELIEELVRLDGLAKLQDKLIRSHALVSRRRLGNVEAVARQLFQLTVGLEREGLATQVLLALWEDLLQRHLDEETGKHLEQLAGEINSCLSHDNQIDHGKREDLRGALAKYQETLAGRVGATAARITMLTRAFPPVAQLVREGLAAPSAS
jgi:hypothetical protein